MATQYANANTRQLVHEWWDKTQQQLSLFLEVMGGGGYISKRELDNALLYITVRRDEFLDSPYPPIAEDVHSQLLEALNNLQQSLDYRVNNNAFYAQSRLNMAQANMDVVRFHLISFGIIS